MNKERAREILKKLNDNDYYLLKPKKDKPFEIDSENRFDELHQALDIAIESLMGQRQKKTKRAKGE